MDQAGRGPEMHRRQQGTAMGSYAPSRRQRASIGRPPAWRDGHSNHIGRQPPDFCDQVTFSEDEPLGSLLTELSPSIIPSWVRSSIHHSTECSPLAQYRPPARSCRGAMHSGPTHKTQSLLYALWPRGCSSGETCGPLPAPVHFNYENTRQCRCPKPTTAP